MTEKTLPDFIIIDDDYINNVICQMIIQNELQATRIDFFTTPQKGIDYIKSTYSRANANDAVLFLDINMPVLNGWDVLEQLKHSGDRLKLYLRIFIFSSSATQRDKRKAAESQWVSGYIEKPLKPADLQSIIANKVADKIPSLIL